MRVSEREIEWVRESESECESIYGIERTSVRLYAVEGGIKGKQESDT